MAVDPDFTRSIIDLTMACPEYIRLRQHYEASLRHWGLVLLSPIAEPIGTVARLAVEIKQKALAERNAASTEWVFTSRLAQSVIFTLSVAHRTAQVVQFRFQFALPGESAGAPIPEPVSASAVFPAVAQARLNLAYCSGVSLR
jgi:hypothetical protein